MSIPRLTLRLLTASRSRPLVGRKSLRQGNPPTRSRPSESVMRSAGVRGMRIMRSAGVRGMRMGFGHKRGVPNTRHAGDGGIGRVVSATTFSSTAVGLFSYSPAVERGIPFR